MLNVHYTCLGQDHVQYILPVNVKNVYNYLIK